MASVGDTRLQWLLSLPHPELWKLYRTERRQLRVLGQRAERIRHDFHGGRSTTREASQRLDELARRMPSMLTAGVRRGRRRSFDFSVLLVTSASRKRMQDAGLRVRSAIEVAIPGHGGPRLRVVSALADRNALDQVARTGIARAIELARPWRPALDTAVPEAQLDGIKEGKVPVTGRGVVIGVIDLAALDFYHLDFRQDAPGNPTRVKFLWDQQLTPQNEEQWPAPGGGLMGPACAYGVEYTEADINAELLGFKPGTTPAYQVVRHEPAKPPISAIESHGTSVTSCAAGNGLASGRRYRGGAPEADIIYVRLAKLDPMGALADHANVLDAFAYIFTRAGAQPCVVNMSLSDLQGAHDGTSLGELFLDALLGVPGRAITVTAGNANGDWRHAAGTVQQGQVTAVQLEFGGGAKSSDAVEFWYASGDRFEATFVLPDGVTTVGPVHPQGMEEATLDNGVRITLASQLAATFSGANRVGIYLDVPQGQKIPLGTWELRLRGIQVALDGAFEAWIDRNNKYANFAPPHRVENEGTLGVPGTARGVITVGAQRKGLPGVALFSGRGPTRDGRDKPDLLAVGTSITAATAVHRNLSPPGTLEYRSGNNGTSYAAPLTAAACALLFECLGPSATSDQLKAELLARAADSADGVDKLLQVGLVCP